MVGKAKWLVACGIVLTIATASHTAIADDVDLVQAAKNRDSRTVRALLARAVDVNAPHADGATALHWAAHWNDVDTADALIRSGANVNAANVYAVTPLSLACTNGAPDMVEKLLKAGANPNAAQSSGETPLMTAARTGSVAAVKTLLAFGAQLEAKEASRGQTALMSAAAQQHVDVVRLLIEHRANVNARSTAGFTPLMFAARHGNLDVSRMLLEGGANVNEAASDGSSALQVAVVRGHVALARFLLEHRADPNAIGAGYTPLHWAAGSWETSLTGNFGIESSLSGLHGSEKIGLVTLLLDHGADPNARVVRNPPRFGFNLFRLRLAGATPFFLAAMAADPAVMRLLLARGANPSMATNDHTTPLMVAAGIGRVVGETRITESSALEAVELLFELKADVNAVNDAGETALFGPAYTGADKILQFLVAKGAAVNAKNKRGQTPLDIAEGDTFASGAVIVHKSTVALLKGLGATSRKTDSR